MMAVLAVVVVLRVLKVEMRVKVMMRVYLHVPDKTCAREMKSKKTLPPPPLFII
jgi:hypothetical protein